MSAQEMKLFAAGEWLVASDESPGTMVPRDSERWIAADCSIEVKR